MAPVKRTAPTAQRETRNTRAAAVAKKKAVGLDKKTESLSTGKTSTISKVEAVETRLGKKTNNRTKVEDVTQQNIEGHFSSDTEAVVPVRTRSTRATASSRGLAAAPRRRIKVTPLDATTADTATSVDTTEDKKRKTKQTPAIKSSARSRAAAGEATDQAETDAPATKVESKSTRKGTAKSKDDGVSKSSTQKTRGRPKAQKNDDTVTAARPETEILVTKRTTRSQRAESTVSTEEPRPDTVSDATKPVLGVRKKVTFQDLPIEDNKENQPLQQSKTKKGAATTATGLRAKPLRRAATSTAASRSRKTGSHSTKTSPTDLQEPLEKEERKIARVLTPKKITQVARSSSPAQQESEASDGEDELNGGKTPIRDLSVSPKRPANIALARALSPAKKLDFGSSLLPKSPDRTAVFRDNEVEQSRVLASPARRPAASPFKNALKTSPVRGLCEGSMALFPSQKESTMSIALNAVATNGAAPTMSTMLQSPKRAGILDSTFFSQSAAKKSISKSPFKASLFGTPAKRLFSPTKKNSSIVAPKEEDADVTDEEANEERETDSMELESEVTASSHFRSSSSPLRVVHVDPNAGDFDFDDSILQVRSPLKVQKTPLRMNVRTGLETSAKPDGSVSRSWSTTASSITEAIEPAALDIVLQDVGTDADSNEEVSVNSDVSDNFEKHNVVEHVAERKIGEAGHFPAQSTKATRPSMSQVLFRSNDTASEEGESSEDELAGDRTPIGIREDRQPNASNLQSRSRLSTGVPQSVSGKGFGFTPLAAQMSGWLASSPEKSPEQQVGMSSRQASIEFSPLARQHIDGEVVISRDSTPVQKLTKRMSLAPASVTKTTASSKKSLDLRKSMIQRQSLGLLSTAESPARNPQFEEYMEIRAMEEQANPESVQDEFPVDTDDRVFDSIMAFDEQTETNEDVDETILDTENEDNKDQHSPEAGDLTTDLINFTNASDTAMVDFQKLAEEANELAPEGHNHVVNENDNLEDVASAQDEGTSASLESSVPNVKLVEACQRPQIEPLVDANDAEVDNTTLDEPVQDVPSPVLQAVTRQLESPSVLIIGEEDSSLSPPSSPFSSSVDSPSSVSIIRTPQPNLRLNERRIVNTVISKVPLKPEGSISPIKISRKRSRSFGNSESSPPKRMSFENLRPLPSIQHVDAIESPNRRLRTSVAPSPGGTSTPATAKSYATQTSRYSFGNFSNVTTPGQRSFAIDDFGDSTLDGIELPEDFEDTAQLFEVNKSPIQSVRHSSCAPSPATPKTISKATPVTARRSTRRATTPAGSSKKTPEPSQKSARASIGAATAERIPLEPVGKGVLYGATVFVDVHTSEGADASGIFIELLAQMGARCVKDWRWNPRVSLAPGVDLEVAEQKIGITHVVFKDGGKRTLEKVRDAKGEVCCVGVAWVLDCERENKWLDESNYVVDATVLPRGGSKRRKSMEPRALLVGNDGSVSASRPRRSVSAEMSELMKRELVNTPARGQSPAQLYDDEDEENDENAEQVTPTGFVSYDPRMAMTPGTPYLAGQGKKLTQMSAPPKQHNKSLFADEDEENEDTFLEGEHGNSGVVKDARKFRMKNLGDMAKRRRTLGWKPAVGSPLGRH